MDSINLRDPNTLDCRVYVGHLNENISQELLDVKFSAYGKIVGFLRTSPGYAFIQYEQSGSAANAIQAENGSILGSQRILVKAAEMKSQPRAKVAGDTSEPTEIEPMNKKYFSEANEYYGRNSILNTNTRANDSDVNHCEIIVVSKNLTLYAEDIESRLKMLGLRVDLLYPNDQVPINKVLGNIQSRGCLYAILVLPANMDNSSLTLTILYGDAVEHRNMPTEDAIRFIYKDFINKTKKITQRVNQHPDAIQTLLKTLTDNRSLTVLQYDHLIKYLTGRREIQRKAEIGEDADTNDMDVFAASETKFEASIRESHSKPIATPAVVTQTDLKMKIFDILNKKRVVAPTAKKVEPKPMTQVEKDMLKKKILMDDKVRQAMEALKNRSK